MKAKSRCNDSIRKLWDGLYGSKWIEVVIPTITPANEQFIGFMIPILGETSIADVLKYGDEFSGDGRNEVALVEKERGGKGVFHLVVVIRFETHLDRKKLESEASRHAAIIRKKFAMPSLFIQIINYKDAERHLS